MNKNEFQALTLDQQVRYINGEMSNGKSFTTICNEIPVSKGGLSVKFKKHDYKLIENQYILQQIPGQQTMFESMDVDKAAGVGEVQESDIVVKGINVYQDDKASTEQQNIINSLNTNLEGANKEAMEAEILKNENAVIKKVGRPQKYNKDQDGNNLDKKKLTIEIDLRVYKALQVKKALEGITINTYIEELLAENIEPKYFEIVDKK